MLTHQQRRNNHQIALWLMVCAAVIYGMIILGGVTRLTGSGLSMVEWRPLLGAIPPLNDAEWLAVFEKYKAFPEYQKVNNHFGLEDFKYIFMYEYLHRLLGRGIGLLFFIPFVYFLLSRKIQVSLKPKLIGLFVLGGLQGLLGWYMVKSGLIDNPRVSQYRLTSHLSVAVLIYASMVWLILDLWFEPTRRRIQTGVSRAATVLVPVVFLMIMSGGLVAGTDAGFLYNTFPKMEQWWLPPTLYSMQPAWLSAFEDLTTIQFNHRILAYVITLFVTCLFIAGIRSEAGSRAKLSLYLLAFALIAQVSLGISTLLMGVPVSLGAAHQGGAIILLTATLFCAHSFRDGRQWH